MTLTLLLSSILQNIGAMSVSDNWDDQLGGKYAQHNDDPESSLVLTSPLSSLWHSLVPWHALPQQTRLRC